MKSRWTLSLAALALCGASAAHGQAADVKTYAGSSEVEALIAKAAADIKPDQPIIVQPLIRLAPYRANLEYRQAPVPPAVHITEAEFFYVIDGAGTLTTGGELVDPTRPNAANLSGKAIVGGTTRRVGKGDFFIVPQDTPHWFSEIDGALVMMSLHVPRPVPAQ
jgi:mannose-6-phosphate isomerase-like protein (cupin superfamily)